MSIFFTDSDCELWFDKVDAENIRFFPMPYVVNGEEFFYDMGRNTDTKAFFDKMRKGATVKTCALNMQDYIAAIEPIYAEGEDIIYVSFSHKMSGTFNSLDMALKKLKETYPDRKTTVVDTKSISAAGGLIAYEAAKLHNAGASDEEVVAFVEKFRERVKCYFTVDDLIYLKRGGRISAVKAALGTLFKVKPVICTMNGALENVDRFKGRFRSLKALADYAQSACRLRSERRGRKLSHNPCGRGQSRRRGVRPRTARNRPPVGGIVDVSGRSRYRSALRTGHGGRYIRCEGEVTQ